MPSLIMSSQLLRLITRNEMHVFSFGKERYKFSKFKIIIVFFTFSVLSYSIFDRNFWVLGLEIEHNGILLITDFSGRPTGEAFVQFTNVGDGKGALQKHKESMGHRFVGSQYDYCLKGFQVK